MGLVAVAMQTVKLCECGCGLPAPIAKKTRTSLGYVKGQQLRFRQGHWARLPENRAQLAENRYDWTGRKHSEETKTKTRGANSYGWKGDDASYSAIHTWLRKYREKAGVCDECGASAFTEWANVSGEYRRDDPDDWRELCRSCHKTYDGIVENLRGRQ